MPETQNLWRDNAASGTAAKKLPQTWSALHAEVTRLAQTFNDAVLLLDQKLFALEGRLEQLEAKSVVKEKRPTRAGEHNGKSAI